MSGENGANPRKLCSGRTNRDRLPASAALEKIADELGVESVTTSEHVKPSS